MRIFKEQQRFRQTWLILLMIISTLVPLGIIIGSYIKNPNSFTPLELVSVIGIILLASAMIFLFKLTTRIDEKGIHYRFQPFLFSTKTINWSDLNKAYVRKYDALGEYGGWGLKGGSLWNKSKSKAINVSGDFGIQLEFKNDKKLLIGTQKKSEAEKVLETYNHKIN